ncbi:MAG: J domain-containing protein [Proteobacteria bacterium]|nr:J domain-containing protein [Pseudomonadota bacterium]
MITFQRIFQTRQQALDVYRSQLSSQKLYVESFEGYPKGSEASVSLEIRETGKKISLPAVVERVMGKKEVTELGYGQRPGILLNVPITPDIVEPFRNFFLPGEDRSACAPVRPTASSVSAARGSASPSSPVRPTASSVVSRCPAEPAAPAAPSAPPAIPFEKLVSCTPQEAKQEVESFFKRVETGNIYQLFNVRADYDKKTVRRIYNGVVRVLHPDAQAEWDAELSEKLGDAYQILNEAYKILQNPVLNAVYMDISRANRAPGGMSLNAYKKYRSDYDLRNAANVRLADELAGKAEDALNRGCVSEAEQHIRLALQYDPYNIAARSIQL